MKPLTSESAHFSRLFIKESHDRENIDMDDSNPDLECFEALPDDTFETIGHSARAIRMVMEVQERTIQVVKYLHFTKVPPSVAENDFRKSAKQMYNYDTQSMIIKLADRAHEVAKGALFCAVNDILRNIGPITDLPFSPCGSARVRCGYCSKEPNGSWVPNTPIPGRDKKCPTVVIEIGVLESYRKLKADAEWWLAKSQGQVKLVVIAAISRKTPKIKFETIVFDNAIPTVRQSVTTSREPKESDAPVIISPAEPLIVRTEELLGHKPISLPEQDNQISLEHLDSISCHVWSSQGL